MYKEIIKNDTWENVSRSEYGLPNRANDLEKLNNNSNDNKIIVYTEKNIIIESNIKNNINNSICISINNIKLQNIIEATITTSLNDICSCSIILTKINNIKIFDSCIILNNSRIALNGFIKNIIPVFNGTNNYYIIQVKSIVGILLDTIVPLELSFINCNLKEIVNKICNYFNIIVNFDDNNIINYKINNEIENSITADVKESCWNFLIRLCNSRGLLIQDLGNKLQIGRIKPNKSKLSLIYGQSNVINWLPIYNYDNLARYYEVYSQFNINSKELITFNLIKLPITKRIINKDINPGAIKEFANWFICRDIGKAIKIELDIEIDLNLNVGDFIGIQNKFIGFETQTDLIVEKIILNYPKSMGLILTLPCAYSGVMPNILPFCRT